MRLIIVALLTLTIPANAGTMLLLKAGSIGWSGPGDILAGATVWYGLRAYNIAYATGSNPAIRIRRSADNHQCDILITIAGTFGNTSNCSTGGDNGQSAIAFQGIHGSCTGTISGATLTCTASTVTPVAADLISATGVYGLYINSCGTFVAGAGTCTLNGVVGTNISTPETVTFVNLALISTWYDQSGNGTNVTQTTPGQQIAFNSTGYNGILPVVITGTTNLLAVTVASTNNTYLTSGAVRQLTFTTQMGIAGMADSTTQTNGVELRFTTSANTVGLFGGSVFTATASDSNFHTLQGVANGASSVLSVDGVETTGNAGSGAAYTKFHVGESSNNGTLNFFLRGSLTEVGAWAALPSSGVRGSMYTNMKTYWGTP